MLHDGAEKRVHDFSIVFFWFFLKMKTVDPKSGRFWYNSPGFGKEMTSGF